VAISDELKAWWTKALLGEQTSAHPIFGRDIDIDVDGPVVTLSGTVETADQAEDIEREALRLPTVDKVVNHLTVQGNGQTCHFQAVIAVFPDAESARLAWQGVVQHKFHDGRSAELLETPEQARGWLAVRGRAAGIGEDRVERYVDLVARGKVLMVDRVPEDDAFRVISAFEGTVAEKIYTLPPEPQPCAEG